MSGAYRPWFCSILLALACTGQAGEGPIVLELEVPDDVSRRAAARLAGESGAGVPVLRIEGVEIGADERLELRLVDPGVDPDADAAHETRILAQAATVGTGDGSYGPPLVLHTLLLPLDQDGWRLLAGQKRVRLLLEVESVGDRPPLRYERIHFESEAEPTPEP